MSHRPGSSVRRAPSITRSGRAVSAPGGVTAPMRPSKSQTSLGPRMRAAGASNQRTARISVTPSSGWASLRRRSTRRSSAAWRWRSSSGGTSASKPFSTTDQPGHVTAKKAFVPSSRTQ